LELTALAIWGVHLWRLMSRREAAESRRPAPILVQLDSNRSARPITADQLVAEVLDRHPDLLEIFVSYGFAPLKNPLMRATVARITTIRRACATLDVDLEWFLAALNAAADGLPGVHGDPAFPE
jgi:hypothetical protein